MGTMAGDGCTRALRCCQEVVGLVMLAKSRLERTLFAETARQHHVKSALDPRTSRAFIHSTRLWAEAYLVSR